MPDHPLKDNTAIVGIGWTPFTRESGLSVGTLAAQAALAAIEDAGLRVEDIDGLVTYFYERRGFRAAAYGLSPEPENEPDVKYVWEPEEVRG